jgi:flagellar biogenesis protein FliO
VNCAAAIRIGGGLAGGLWLSPVAAQLAGGGAAPDVDYLRVVLALLFCLVLGVGVVVLLRRFAFRGGRTSGAGVSVVGVVPLGRGSTLYVIEFDGRRLLIGSSASGLRTLAQAASVAPATDGT